MNAIEIHSLTKSYGGKQVLNSLSMQVAKGDIYGFLGPNGAGKTTTLRILLGLLNSDGGTVRVFKKDPQREGATLRSRIGSLPETPGFYGWMDARENLGFYAEICGVRHSPAAISSYLEMVGLDPENSFPVATFSKGMKQRLGLARCLVHDPELLLLDEPTNGLDPKGRHEIYALLQKLNRERGMTIILSTHILDDVERLCHTIGILYRGTLHYQGPLMGDLENTYIRLTREAIEHEPNVSFG